MIDWINVNHRLPECMDILPCSSRVLISTAIGVVTAQYDYESNEWIDFYPHKFSSFAKPNYYDKSMRVTHWAELPKPPKYEPEVEG